MVNSLQMGSFGMQAVLNTAKKIPFMYFLERNCAASVPISTFMICERFMYSHDRSTYFPAADRQTDRGNIYKSFTET
jgi:hypothetical protein